MCINNKRPPFFSYLLVALFFSRTSVFLIALFCVLFLPQSWKMKPTKNKIVCLAAMSVGFFPKTSSDSLRNLIESHK